MVITANISHSIVKRSPFPDHSVYETIAHAACSTIGMVKEIEGWVFTINRPCPHHETCIQMCNSLYLRVLDTQTSYLSWSAIGALHVYVGRQSSGFRGLGLKVLWITDYEYHYGCGPNYCCCGVRLPHL